MLQILLLLLLPGVLSSEEWNVNYPELPICAVRGSNVTIPCSFKYPNNTNTQETQVSWCSTTKQENCDREGPYVYNSTSKTNQSNFHYTGDETSNCSLLISNINSTSSGVYIFRFITKETSGCWTGPTGVNVTVTDLSTIMLGNNGSIRAGDSLNLTCTSSCPGPLPELQWFRNDVPLKQSDPVLTLNTVSSEDSGNYSCSLKQFKSSVSEPFTLYVIAIPKPFTFWIMITGVSLASIFFIFVCVIFIITRRQISKRKQTAKEKEETQRSQAGQEEEIQYASVSIRPRQMSASTEEQTEDSTIYSGVRVN